MGVTKPRFLWFLIAVIPCGFSGISAALLLIPMIILPMSGGGIPQAPIFALEGMGWLSALAGVILVHYRFAFLRRSPKRQRNFAMVVWGIHLLAFAAWFLTLLIMEGGP